MSESRLHRTLTIGARFLLAVLLATAITWGPARAADGGSGDPGSQHTLTAQAREHGLDAAGGGEMGWADPGAGASALSPAAQQRLADRTVDGLDVSHYQGDVDWASYYAQGKRFAFVKATEGTYYTSDTFEDQYAGARDAGLVRGAYHFANPQDSSGATQAQFFVDHGGAWTADGSTLPGVLDIEYDPYDHGVCYGLSRAEMVSWIQDFTTTYRTLTGRDAIIYTATEWWRTCTGDTDAFAATNPLWIAHYAKHARPLPAGWRRWTFWQYTDTPVDQDYFRGTESKLGELVDG